MSEVQAYAFNRVYSSPPVVPPRELATTAHKIATSVALRRFDGVAATPSDDLCPYLGGNWLHAADLRVPSDPFTKRSDFCAVRKMADGCSKKFGRNEVTLVAVFQSRRKDLQGPALEGHQAGFSPGLQDAALSWQMPRCPMKWAVRFSLQEWLHRAMREDQCIVLT
jgi:hypothetical protein